MYVCLPLIIEGSSTDSACHSTLASLGSLGITTTVKSLSKALKAQKQKPIKSYAHK
jgi:hypothetical protein